MVCVIAIAEIAFFFSFLVQTCKQMLRWKGSGYAFNCCECYALNHFSLTMNVFYFIKVHSWNFSWFSKWKMVNQSCAVLYEIRNSKQKRKPEWKKEIFHKIKFDGWMTQIENYEYIYIEWFLFLFGFPSLSSFDKISLSLLLLLFYHQ